MAIVVSTRISDLNTQKRILENEIETKRREIENIEEQLREPNPWLEETTMRLVISNMVGINLTLFQKELIDYLFSAENDITIEKVEDVTYIYLNYILPEHQTLLESYGVVIENRMV